MSPADGYARTTVEYFARLRSGAVEHRWEEPNTLLLIDNTVCLHGRGAVGQGDEDRRLERATLRLEKSS